jgi:hypothetical protein
MPPPDGPGHVDPEVEQIVDEFFESQKSWHLTSPEKDWWFVPDDPDGEEWLALTTDAQAAWLCGPDAWFPAYRTEPVAPYSVVRMKRMDVDLCYEIGPERPHGIEVRITDSRGKIKEQTIKKETWDRSEIERIARYCGPSEKQYWSHLGDTSL